MHSRWSTAPITKNGHIIAARPNVPGDIDILKALGRYSLLTADDIAAVNGRSYGAVIARLKLLKKHPQRLIKVHDSQLDQPRQYQYIKQAFQLTSTGVGKLLELALEPKKPKPNKHFVHSLTEAQTAASFEVGARLHHLKQVALQRSPISVPYKDKHHTIFPDGGPIGLGYPDGWNFFVFETDCATEPLSSNNKDRQAIEAKFATYMSLLQRGLYEINWKLPNLSVLFTTVTEARMKNMMELLASMTDDHTLRNCFAFKVFPTIFGKQPEQGWAVREPWSRVGTPLNLAKS